MSKRLEEFEQRIERLEMRDVRAKVLRLEKEVQRLTALLQAAGVVPAKEAAGHGLRLVKGGAS